MPGYIYKLFNCKVRLRGADNLMIVPKSEVTIPEVRVLQELHGVGNIIEVMQSLDKFGRQRVRANVPAGGEVDRLRQLYNLENRPVVDKLFPGAYPQLPTSLSQIGVTLWAPPIALAPELGEDDAPQDGEPDEMSEEELERATAPDNLTASEAEKEAEIKRRFTEGQEKRRRNADTGRQEPV